MPIARYLTCTRCGYREGNLLTPEQEVCEHLWVEHVQPRYQAIHVPEELLKSSCLLHGLFDGDRCPMCEALRGPAPQI